MTPSLSNFFFISILSSIIFAATFTHSYSQCLDNQKSLLVELKNELIFNPSLSRNLLQWNQTDDCCEWNGVGCDAAGNVVSLDLNDEAISGGIGDSSSLFRLEYLEMLYLAYNDFNEAPFPKGIQNLTSLTHLKLANNMFKGSLSSTFFEDLPNLVRLDLGYNQLEGPIPHSLFRLQSLENLSLLKNLFHGDFDIDQIQNLVNLTYLDLSNNNLSVYFGHINSSTHGLPHLKVLNLASCNLSDFPGFIKHMDIEFLDLSHNQIAGEIPSWIWGKQYDWLDLSFNLLTDLQKPCYIPASLRFLYLNSNKLRGELNLLIPPSFGNRTPSLSDFRLYNNSLSGPIPTAICSATNLSSLDLSQNKLNGSIPSCLLENVRVLALGQNNFSGRIPDILNAPNCNIECIDVYRNTLVGKFPDSLKNCKSLDFVNVGNNMIDDAFPCFMSSTLRVLVLRSNRFHGEVRCNISWPNLQVIDISSNNFSGSLDSLNFSSWTRMTILGHSPFDTMATDTTLIVKGQEMGLHYLFMDFSTVDFSSNNFQGGIPNSIGDLISLRLLNLSHNALNGSIPKSFGKLGVLEGLDLSVNQLAGRIPEELARLTFLSVFNVSYNKLVGKIPNGRQLQTFPADSFKGNPGLCGFNLNISCSDRNLSSPGIENEQSKREIEWEYVCAALGYVVGLGIIVWLLLFCRRFRQKYFGKIEEVVEEIVDARDRDRRRRRARREVTSRAGRH